MKSSDGDIVELSIVVSLQCSVPSGRGLDGDHGHGVISCGVERAPAPWWCLQKGKQQVDTIAVKNKCRINIPVLPRSFVTHSFAPQIDPQNDHRNESRDKVYCSIYIVNGR